MNYGGSTLTPTYKAADMKGGPFRSFFSCRYYLIDLEYANIFDSTNGNVPRMVTSHPVLDPNRHNGRCGGMRYGKVSGLCFTILLWDDMLGLTCPQGYAT